VKRKEGSVCCDLRDEGVPCRSGEENAISVKAELRAVEGRVIEEVKFVYVEERRSDS